MLYAISYNDAETNWNDAGTLLGWSSNNSNHNSGRNTKNCSNNTINNNNNITVRSCADHPPQTTHVLSALIACSQTMESLPVTGQR